MTSRASQEWLCYAEALIAAIAFALTAGFVASRVRCGRRDGEINALGVAPEPLEIVILPRPFAENVHDEIAVIEQHPFGAGFAFAMGQADAVTLEPFLDGFADGLNLRLALRRSKAGNIPRTRPCRRDSAP